MMARLSKSHISLKETNFELIKFLLESFSSLFPMSLICSFSSSTLKILIGIFQNMFTCQHLILKKFSEKMLLQIHLSLDFEDLIEVLTRILCQENISKSKLELNIMMLVRAIQKADSGKLSKFVHSANFYKLLKFKKEGFESV